MIFLVQIGKIWISALNQVKTDARKTDLKQTGMLPSWIPTIYLLNFRPWAHKSLHSWVFPSLDWDLKPGFLVAAVWFLFLLTMQWVSIDAWLNRRNYYFEHLWTTSPVYHQFITIFHHVSPVTEWHHDSMPDRLQASKVAVNGPVQWGARGDPIRWGWYLEVS